MREIIFEVREDDTDGGFVATAIGHSVITRGGTIPEIRNMVRDAVSCHFGDSRAGTMPTIIRLLFIRDEILPV